MAFAKHETYPESRRVVGDYPLINNSLFSLSPSRVCIFQLLRVWGKQASQEEGNNELPLATNLLVKTASSPRIHV